MNTQTNAEQPRVLIVEDDRDTSHSLALFLTAAGYCVRQSNDGAAAIAISSAFRPQIVLVNIGMPEAVGYDLAKHVRTNHNGSVLIIAIAANDHIQDRERERAAGFDHHFKKPTDLDLLLSLISHRWPSGPGAPIF